MNTRLTLFYYLIIVNASHEKGTIYVCECICITKVQSDRTGAHTVPCIDKWTMVSYLQCKTLPYREKCQPCCLSYFDKICKVHLNGVLLKK